MKKLRRIKLNRLKGFFKKLPKILGQHTFLTFLGFLLIALILGSLIFYQYSILAEKEKIEISDESLKFKEETYQEVLRVWQEKEIRFLGADLKEYPDPFR